MRKKIIVLANSRKAGNRCIAGIDIDTGEWIRPVYGDGKEGIPYHVRNVNGREPKLLDIISIPLADDGPHRDIQPENRQILKGEWEKIGKASIEQLEPYIKKDGIILHSPNDRIHISNLKRPVQESICLIDTVVTFFTTSDIYGRKRVNAEFTFSENKYILPVTCYNFWESFPPYSSETIKCPLTISMGLPFYDRYCYKFVAGVIAIEKINLDSIWDDILIEI